MRFVTIAATMMFSMFVLPPSAVAQASDGRVLERDIADFVRVCLAGRSGSTTRGDELRKLGFRFVERTSDLQSWMRRGTQALLKKLDDGSACIFNLRTNELRRVKGLMQSKLLTIRAGRLSPARTTGETTVWTLNTSGEKREVRLEEVGLVNGPSVAFLVAF